MNDVSQQLWMINASYAVAGLVMFWLLGRSVWRHRHLKAQLAKHEKTKEAPRA